MKLSFIFAYYDNPNMLARQYEIWASYRQDIKDQMEVVLVDDASPRYPAKDVRKSVGLPPMRIFRVEPDIHWHWDGARNLGAHVASGDYLLMTDMDHIIPDKLVDTVLKMELNPHAMYSFGRTYSDGQPLPGHLNSFMVAKTKFWEIGGYDEAYTGNYLAQDVLFLRRAYDLCKRIELGCPLVWYSEHDVYDSQTHGMDRTFDKARQQAITARKVGKEIKTLDFRWKEE